MRHHGGLHHISQARRRRRELIAAAVAIAIVALAGYAGWVQKVPFSSEYELQGVFRTANQLRHGSDVRVSGLRIGRVKAIEPGPGRSSVVRFSVEDRSVPIRADAQLSIKPRLALEGNYYIDVSPGSPSAPPLDSGETVPLARTAGPVQIDQVVGVFNRRTRESFKRAIGSIASGLGSGAKAGAPQGRSGARGLRHAARELDGALGSLTRAADAAQGTRPGDLSRAIGSSGDVADQLAADPSALADLVTNYDRVFAALAANDAELGAAFRELDALLRGAPAQLTSIDAALPTLATFARALRPGLQVAPPALSEGQAALEQLELLTRKRELPRLLAELEPVSERLPTLNRQLRVLFPLLTPVAKCVSRNVVPVLNQEIEDGPHTTNRPAWQDLLQVGAGLAGVAANFDGNGTTLRLGVVEDQQAVALSLPPFGEVIGMGTIEGVSPTWLGPGVTPEYRPDQRCIDQDVADLNVPGRRSGPPAQLKKTSLPRGPLAAGLRSALLLRDVDEILSLLGLDGRRKGNRDRPTSSPAGGSSPARGRPRGGEPGSAGEGEASGGRRELDPAPLLDTSERLLDGLLSEAGPFGAILGSLGSKGRR